MNEMQVFQNSEFGELGVLEIEGKPWFPATACAKSSVTQSHTTLFPSIAGTP